ncbi:MAG: nucleotidyl transferase AbiEii/AbiGii toxin family protein [Sandaracinus sp.]
MGAAALGHHIPLSRVTRDVDLALVVAPQEISGLLSSLGWRRDERLTHRWYGAAGFRADVLPATPELVTTGSVQLDRGEKVMSLVGFDLALAHAATIVLDGTDADVKVASLPSLVLLKIVAWHDRPSERTKDLGDIALALINALSEDDDRRWDRDDPIGASGVQFDEQSPYFVGLELGRIASEPHLIETRRFIDTMMETDTAAAAAMARAADIRGEDPDELMRRYVNAFALGLQKGAQR